MAPFDDLTRGVASAHHGPPRGSAGGVMGDKTGIEWADATWNPFTGCTTYRAGCDNCYAASLASGRLAHASAYAGLASGGKFNGTVRLLPDRLDQPQRWRKPRRIFVNSMGDLFHEGVSDEYIAQVWQVMATCPQHQFLILTKRHARMRAWVNRVKLQPRRLVHPRWHRPARRVRQHRTDRRLPRTDAAARLG